MKVLQLSNKIPYPEKDGGAIAINAVTEGLLKAGCDVKMLTMNTKKHFVEVDSIPEKFRNERHLEAVAIDGWIDMSPEIGEQIDQPIFSESKTILSLGRYSCRFGIGLRDFHSRGPWERACYRQFGSAADVAVRRDQ